MINTTQGGYESYSQFLECVPKKVSYAQ